MKNIFVKIYDFIVYDIKYGVKNLFKYFKIVWQDRDYDQYFLFKLLHFKLKGMENVHRYYGHLKNGKRYADQIRLCVLLLDRILKDDYYENVFKNHDKKWGELEWNTAKESEEYFRDNENSKKLYKLLITRPNIKTKEDEKQERKEFRILSKKVGQMEKQDIDLLFKKISKQINCWWD